MNIETIKRLRRRPLVLGGLLLTLPSPARAQAPGQPPANATAAAGADSLTGSWESRSRNPAYNGQLTLRMTLKQHGDSVAGTVVLEYRDQASEAPTDVAGTVHDGKLTLGSRFNVLQLEGVMKSGKLQTRITPGEGQSANSFSATFTRVR